MEQDLSSLYHCEIRTWAREVRNDRRLTKPDVTITKTSRTCGSSLTLDLSVETDSVVQIGWMARACTLGMASLAILVDAAPGLTLCEIEQARLMLRKLLQEGSASFSQQWNALALFTAARQFPGRHESILLPFDAICAAKTQEVEGLSKTWRRRA